MSRRDDSPFSAGVGDRSRGAREMSRMCVPRDQDSGPDAYFRQLLAVHALWRDLESEPDTVRAFHFPPY